MNSQLTAYVALICTSGVLNLYLCLYVYINRHRYKNIGQTFILYTASITLYCFASALILLSTTLEQIKFWNTIMYIGMPVSTALGLIFIMKYIGMNVTRRSWLLIAIPLVTTGMVATNDWHKLHYRVFEIDPALGIPFVYQEIGIWYMIHGVYIFSCMLAAFLLAINHLKETAKIYLPQLITLILGQFIPMITAFLYLIGVTPKGVDPVPMVLWLSSLLYLWSISSSRMFTLMPIAKDAIFNSINDGVMVLDEFNRLIEYNRACKAYFPQLDRALLGVEFQKVWKELSGNDNVSELKLTDYIREEELTTNNTKRIYQIRTSPLVQVKNSKGYIMLFTDITELKELQNKLEYQANYDELTQIYNRRAFIERCERDYAAARHKHLPFSVMLLDIDYFKKVNDTYGHSIGDFMLKHVVGICKSQLLNGQVMARYGGEEFALYFIGYTAVEAKFLGNKLRQSIEKERLHSSKGAIPVTVSMGVAEAKHDYSETLEQLLNKADYALYSAKQAGRNQIHMYSDAEA